MRKTLVAFALVAVFCLSCASGRVDVSELEEQDGVAFVSPGEPYSGEAVAYHASGALRLQKKLVNGRTDGVLAEWYENGEKKVEEQWKDGKRHGACTYWYQNGQVEREEKFDMGSPVGVHVAYFENGQMKTKMPYVDGKPYGVWQYWAENGVKEKHEVYEDGVLVRTDGPEEEPAEGEIAEGT